MATPLKSEKFIVTSEYFGLQTLRSATEIQRGAAALALNSDHSSSSTLSPFQGYSNFGNQANATDVITRKFNYRDGLGFQIPVQVRDNATTAILEYFNPGDTRNSTDGEWETLVTGLTTAINSDVTVNKRRVMGFTAFNDRGVNNLLFCNGVENFSRWSGAICVMDGAVAENAGTITVKKVTGDPKANPTDGFPSSGTLTYKDTAGVVQSLAYSSKTATVFTMSTPGNTTASADTTGVAETADTSTHSGLPENNILDTAQGRVIACGLDSTPNTVNLSRVGDFTDFTTSTVAADAQIVEFESGGSCTGLAHMDDWFFALKESETWAWTFTPSTVEDGSGGSVDTISTFFKRIAQVGCSNQKAIADVNDDIWFITSRGQIRRLFRLEGETGFSTEDLMGIIRPSVKNFNWDDGTLEFWEQERIVVAAGRSSTSIAMNDKVITLQLSEKRNGDKIINHSTLDWFVGDWMVYIDELHHGSSLQSKDFKSFDGFSKDGAAYDWVRTERIESFPEIGDRFIQKRIKYLGIEGTISTGCTLNIRIDYDVNGQTATQTMSLEGTDTDFVVFQPLNTLNAFGLNLEPLNSTQDNIGSRNPFFVVFALPNEYSVRNVQLTFKTSGIGQDVQILAHGWVVSDDAQHVKNLKGVG